MAIWLLGYTKRDPLLTYYGSSGWHAHEMLFGYVVAVVAGLLLTAVRNWTQTDSVRGTVLVALCLLWLAGRVLPLFLGLPPWLVATVDMSFLPTLAGILTFALFRTGQSEYKFIPILLVILTAANGLVHSEWLGFTMDTARLGVLIAIYIWVLLITIIAGRVFSTLAESAGDSTKERSKSTIEFMSAGSIILLALADLFAPFVQIVVVCAVFTTVVHARRLFGWFVRPVLSQPLSWVLLIGYAWLVVGFALLAIAYGGWISNMLAFHALMAGGIGVLTLGMMVRMSLGHTGRPMRASPLTSLAFILVNIAVIVRVAGPLLTVRYIQPVISAAGALWITGFVLFLVVYTPVLTQARIDGHSG